MAQAVKHYPLTAEAWVRSWANPYEIYGTRVDLKQIPLRIFQVSPIRRTLPMLHTHIFLNNTLIRRANV